MVPYVHPAEGVIACLTFQTRQSCGRHSLEGGVRRLDLDRQRL